MAPAGKLIVLLEINSTQSVENSTANCARFASYELVSEAGCEILDLAATHKVIKWVHSLPYFTLHMDIFLLCCKRFQPFVTQTLHEKFTGKVMQQAEPPARPEIV